MKRKKGFFSISAVAEMFSVHQQTIRLYEKEGLISPKRSQGNTRLFSEEDIDKLEEIIYLTHQLGINLAGVEMILKLKKKINKMQTDLNKMFDTAQEQLEEETLQAKQMAQHTAQRLLKIKEENQQKKLTVQKPSHPSAPSPETQVPDDAPTVDSWDIEYED